MTFTRREAMAIGGAGATTLFTGCQALTPSDGSADDPPLSLKVYNYTPEPQEVEVEVIDPDVDGRRESVVYSVSNDAPGGRMEIQPPSEGEGITNLRTFEDVVETQPYTVRFRIAEDTTERWRHFHYKPESGTDDHFITLRIYRDEEANEDVVRYDP